MTAIAQTRSEINGDIFTHVKCIRRFYDNDLMKPSEQGINYLLPIFTNAIGHDDVENIRQTLFDSGNLTRPFHSVNTDVNKRIRYLSR